MREIMLLHCKVAIIIWGLWGIGYPIYTECFKKNNNRKNELFTYVVGLNVSILMVNILLLAALIWEKLYKE